MHLNKKIALEILLLLIPVFFSGCNKRDITANQSSLKEYSFNNETMTVVYMEQVSANDILLIGAESYNAHMIHTDLKGNLLSHKTITLPDSFADGNFIGLDIRKLNNGTFLLNRGAFGKFALVDNSGKFLWDRQDSIYYGSSSTILYSQSKNEYIEGYSDGLANGGYSTNTLDIFNGSGAFIKKNYYNDTTYKHGKTLTFNPVGTTPNGEYKVCGNKFLVVGNWSAPTRIYVGKTSGQYLIANIIDSAQTGISDAYNNYFINPTDSGLIIYANRYNSQLNVNSILFLKFDVNMVFQGEYEYKYNNLNTWPINMCKCRDGGFIVCGYYVPNNLPNVQGAESFAQPYVIRVDKNGHKIWEKGFKIPSAGEFYSALELSDGSIALGGTAFGFGKGINSQATGSLGNILFVKLDANGNQE